MFRRMRDTREMLFSRHLSCASGTDCEVKPKDGMLFCQERAERSVVVARRWKQRVMIFSRVGRKAIANKSRESRER